jgi:putative heme-binding domain-containing protein
VPLLAKLFRQTTSPKTKLHVLGTLDGLNALSSELVAEGLRDPHPYVREHTIRVSESLLRQPAASRGDRAEFEAALLGLMDDSEIRVRYQLAFSLGEWPDPLAGRALTALARRDFTNDAMQIAILSSAVPHIDTMLALVFGENPAQVSPVLLEQLLGLAIALGRDAALVKPIEQIARDVNGRYAPWQFDAFAGLLDALDRRKLPWRKLQSEGGADLKAAMTRAEGLFTAARKLAASESGATAAPPVLEPAIRILGRASDGQDEDLKLLSGLLRPQVPPGLQHAALTALSRVGGNRTSDILLTGWRGYSPALRVEVLNVLCRRADWLQALLGALEKQVIPPAQIDPGHQQTLLTHAQTAVRERAAMLFASTRADLEQVLKNYQVVLELRGVPERARALFTNNCATCHQFKGEGTSIGADLASVADKPADYLLSAILDPNRAVEARFISYTAVTRDDTEFTGIITAESPNSITLRSATGEMTILRADLQELTSSSLSLMPEGFEATFKPQDIADLIAFVQSAAGGGR